MASRIRVVHVNDVAFVGSTLVRSLARVDVDARLIEPARPGRTIRYPWKVVTLPIRVAGLIAAGLQVRWGGDDLAHVHYARLGIVGPVGGKPFVLHCHGSDIRGVVPGSGWGRIVGPYFRRARLVYYSTPDLEPWVRAFRPDAVFLPNPIESVDRAGEPAAAGTVDAAAGPTVDVLVGVRLDPVKGVDAIVAIVEELVRRRPATTLSILDQGSLVEPVRIVSGSAGRMVPLVSHAAMAGLFRGHRIAIGQQRVGTLGNYELEAMGAGTPVAATFRYPAAYDSPPPVIDAGSPAQVAERIAGLLDDEAARRDLATAGRDWILGHHAAATVAARVAADYRRLLDR